MEASDTAGHANQRERQSRRDPAAPPPGGGRAAVQAVFDRYQIVDMLGPGPAASGADDPGSDLSLLLAVP